MKRSFRTPGLGHLLLSWMAAVSTAAWALAGTADTPKEAGTRSHAASGPHSDGADAVLQARQRTSSTGKASRGDHQFLAKAAAAGRAEVEMGRLGQSRAQDSEVKRFAERMVQDHTRVNGELQALGSTRGLSWPDEGSTTSTSSPNGTQGTTGMTGGSSSGPGTGAAGNSRTASGTGTGTGTGTGMGMANAGTAASAAGASASGPRSGMGNSTGSGTGSGMGSSMGSGTGHGTSTAGSSEGAAAGLSTAARRSLDRLQGLSGSDFDREFMKQMVTDHKAAVADFQRAAATASDPEVKTFAQRALPGLQEHLQMARSLSERLSASGRH